MEDSSERLRVELKAALATITKLLKDLSDANERVKHLEEMLKNSPLPVVQSKRHLLTVTPEQEIASQQIERLRQASAQRTLTLEEIKAYDVLVKNKRLSEDKSTSNVHAANYRDVSDIELMKIVGDSPNPEENQ